MCGFGGFVDCPIFDVDETVSCVDKAVIFGESADVFVEIIDKAGLVNTDGRNVVDPAVEEGLVFLDAGRFIHGSAGAKNEVIDESVGVIGEVETSGGGFAKSDSRRKDPDRRRARLRRARCRNYAGG